METCIIKLSLYRYLHCNHVMLHDAFNAKKYVSFKDRWSLLAVVSKDRFHCIMCTRPCTCIYVAINHAG